MYKQSNNHYKKFCSLAILAIAMMVTSTAKAQNNSTESPYTRVGIGELMYNSSNMGRALGNTGIALRSKGQINSVNPASYVAVDSQTFILDIAACMGTSWFVEGANRDARLLGNFEYASMLFPIAKWMAVSAGVKPFTSVGYRFGASQSISGSCDREYNISYTGKGNIYELYLGTAFTPFKNFSIGVNGAFLTGEITHVNIVNYGSSIAYNNQFYDALRLRGFKTDLGFQYVIPTSNENSLTLGAVYTPSLPLASRAIHQEHTLQSTGTIGSITVSDTINNQDAYRIPQMMGIGATYQVGNKLLFSADVKYNIWNKVLLETNDFTTRNQWQVGLGAAFTPNAVARSLWERIEYRWGLSASNSYLQLPIADGSYKGYYRGGVSFGMGIPMIDRRSYVDLTFDYGHLLPENKTMVHENYFRFTLGLRFNEAWFRKIKLD